MGSNTQEIHIMCKNGDILSQGATRELKSSVKGDVIIKGEGPEDIYLAAIDRFNKSSILEAGIIVFCESDNDVAACLKYAQQYELELVISCGRHSYYGASSTNGGLVIDLGKMRKVSIDKKTLSIAAQGGCQAADLETPLQAEGFSVVMGAANDTGIGGLTLGGGSGFLSGRYGLVIDNLLAAKVVLADGRVLRASETENSDLFWGLRGGGSNFGVVTEFTYRIHKQPGQVFFGPLVLTPDKTKPFLNLAHTIEKAVDTAGGKLAVFMAFTKLPNMPSVHPLCLVFYDGPEGEARDLLKPLFDLKPVAQMAAMKPYAECTEVGPHLLGPLTHQRYSATNMLASPPLDVEIIQALVDDLDAFYTKYGAAVGPTKIAIEIRSYAKSSSVPPSATALAARRRAIVVVLEGQHDNTVPDATIRKEIKTMMDKTKASFRAKGLSPDEFHNANIATGTEKVNDTFGENLPRLKELKRKYDPNFIFNKWYPISPAEE